MRTLSLLRLKLLQLLLLPPAALIITTNRTLTHSHAHRVGRHARTHRSHCRHAHNYAMLLLVRHYDYTAQTTVQLLYYNTTADGSSQSSLFYTTGRREAYGERLPIFPVDGDTAGAQLTPVRRSARAPRHAARLRRRPVPTTRSTYIYGRASTRCTRIHTHTVARFLTSIQWRREFTLYYY